MRPHVVYVTPIFGYPPMGGPRLRTYNTLRALARVADVSLYLSDQPDVRDPAAARAHLLSFCRDVVFPAAPPAPGRLRRLGRRIQRLWREGDRVRAPDAEEDRFEQLQQWLVAQRPDLLWLGFGGISYHLVPLKRAVSAPVVLETECVWSRFIMREAPFEPSADRRERILAAGRAKQAEERVGALEVDLTTAVSDIDAEYFRSIAPDPARVMLLSNVIDVEAYTRETAQIQLRQPALLFAGTLSHGTANVDAVEWLVDEIMPIVWRARPDARVYLVGRSPAPAVLAKRSPRVHVVGEVRSIVPYMRASAAALVPLRWESGTRFKILEAFACRTPVISTTLGAEGLAVEHGRHLLIADDAAAFAGAIASLLDDRSLRHRLIGPAFDLVAREYDLSAAQRQIEAILARFGLGARVNA